VNNTLLALILPNFLLNGFNVLLVRNYYMNHVPVELIESAKIDGAGEAKIFCRIMFPLSIPVVATVGFFIALMYWNDWINALYYISNPKYYGIQNLLIQLMNNIQFMNSAQGSSLLGSNAVQLPTTAARMAMGVIGIVPIIVAFPFFQRYLSKGIVIGAVKG